MQQQLEHGHDYLFRVSGFDTVKEGSVRQITEDGECVLIAWMTPEDKRSLEWESAFELEPIYHAENGKWVKIGGEE
jgi:hypothetical protein